MGSGPSRGTIALTMAAGMMLAACGGGGEPAGTPSPTEAAPTETAQTETPTESAVPGTPQTATVDQAFWFGGFEVSLGTATYTPEGDTGGSVVIDAMLENLASNTYTFDGTVVLTSAGTSYEPSFESEIPSVPAGGTGDGVVVFSVEPSFTFDDATLTVGTVEVQQAFVPIGGPSELVTLEPVTLSVSGKTSAGELALELSGGELRADVPETHRQSEAGHLALTLFIDVTYKGDFPGGFPFAFANNLALKLPDGTTVAADDGPIELLSPRTTLPDQFVRFTVDSPPEGRYALLLRDDNLDKQRGLRFSI